MIKLIQRLAALFSVTAMLAILVSCGGSSGDSSSSSEGTGTVGILLTDMPADPALFTSIYASFIKVELLGSEDNGRVTLYSGDALTFDLLRLRNESIPLTFKDDVPVGEYCKIRLTLSDLELVLTSGETYHPKIPGNGKLDLLARDCFSVAAGEVVTVQLDIDAGNSIHVIANNKGFNFRPVVFVDVINQGFDSKLVRLTGSITKIDAKNQSLLLCHAIPSNSMDNLGCVTVHLGKESAFFNNKEYPGTPRPIDELLSKDKLGQKVTVVGWPEFWVNSDAGEGQADQYYPLMQIDALVVELGPFQQVEGSVVSVSGETGFDMSVSSSKPVIADKTIEVMYQPGVENEYNGTRIVSKSGQILNSQDIKAFLAVQVDGVSLTGLPTLNAALVIVDKGVPGTEKVTGIIRAIGVNSLTLEPEADTVCGIATVQLEVGLLDNLELLTVTITDDGSEIVPGGMLEVGQSVGMNGTCEINGYQTDNVVIVDDQRT